MARIKFSRAQFDEGQKGSLSVISLNYWLKDNGITEADVDFNDADLSSIVLSGCKFHGLTLHGINFQGCRLNEVSFRGASLHNCTFKHSFLNACTFRDASLDCCDMSSALIVRTDFIGARAEETSFSDAYIAKGNRFSASVMQSPGLRQICPATGAFDAWKIVYVERIPHLIHLRVPENALRSSATSRRCRCSEAKVISIRNLCTHESVNSVTNISYCPCVYTVGKIATPDHFNENRWDECSHGIHVLLTEREAIAYANGLLGARASGWKV